MIKSARLARLAMKLWEAEPDPGDLALAEIFKTDQFRRAEPARRREIMLASARFRHEYELRYPFSRYFPVDVRPFLAGKEVLDLGSFTGGRSVAWYQAYGLRRVVGVDVAPEFIEAAETFAAQHGAEAEFHLAVGERLPFEDDRFEAVATFDVFEHVADLSQVMSETFRVLKPGGVLVAVFPQYMNPFEHHLGMVTRLPGVQWLFDSGAINEAYREILRERGERAAWYAHEFQPWERLHTINGTSIGEFEEIVRERPWETVYQDYMVLLTTTRPIMARPRLKRALEGLRPLLGVPWIRERLADRISVILRKPTG
ncbi:MAG TPA: class I SAM-dependent methyltransferase [Longimicrobiaceae bacterium]|nr:class I SAM-dependent methyltransferase [Longimicrobiaceae bacterium]